jgi:mono/diheme cytochrome c family protein
MRRPGHSVTHTILALLITLAAVVLPGCDYGRMYDQDSIKTYERKMPIMDKRTIPVKDGFRVLAEAKGETLKNPAPYSKESVERGRLAYDYFCVHCHGPKLDGKGTVGQSFAPLPADLISPPVLSMPDGVIYSRIRLGFGRHPALFSTIPPEQAWAVVAYMRSTGRRQ